MPDPPAKAQAAVTPTGIPWRIRTGEVMAPQHMDMLYAILRAVVPPVVRESKARGRKKKLGTLYMPDEDFHKAVARLRKNTVILEAATEEDFESYLAESPTDSMAFRQTLQGMLIDLPPGPKGLLVKVMAALR